MASTPINLTRTLSIAVYRHVRFPYKIRDDMEMPALSIHRVGIVKIRATYVHDNLDGTHGALHHGCYLCVWEGVKAYFSRHMTDSRNIPPAARTIAALRTHEARRSAWRQSTSPYAWGADEGRHCEALLGARHQHHPGDQHVPQAGREGAEDTLRGLPRPAVERGSESMEK